MALLLLTAVISLFSVGLIEASFESYAKLSPFGFEFQPRTNIQLLSTASTLTRLRCSALCNQFPSCRTFDYDSVSQRCRLFEGDASTGASLVSSSSTSVVGTVRLLPSLYLPTHNQWCSTCEQSRYEICSNDTNRCQCPTHSYWNGKICALALFENSTCTQVDACRADLNLTCPANCYGEFQRCIRSSYNCKCLLCLRVELVILSQIQTQYCRLGYGVTVAGGCNGNSSTNQTLLLWPADVLITNNGTLYVANYDNRLLAFDSNNRTARTVATFGNWPTFLFIDNQTANIYVSVIQLDLIYILPGNRTIPPDRTQTGNCSLNRLSRPTVVILDSVGRVYIASFGCHWVTRWAPNATTGTLIAGSPLGNQGSDSQSLNYPYGLALDEPQSFLYVADRSNNRIQRFLLGGSGIGVTVAGGNGPGVGPNQLNGPTEIYLSKLNGSLYIADSYNNRVQRCSMSNSSSCVTVAGSASGTAGLTAYLMDLTYAISVDESETYLYVTDSNNARIQRFLLR